MALGLGQKPSEEIQVEYPKASEITLETGDYGNAILWYVTMTGEIEVKNTNQSLEAIKTDIKDAHDQFDQWLIHFPEREGGVDHLANEIKSRFDNGEDLVRVAHYSARLTDARNDRDDTPLLTHFELAYVSHDGTEECQSYSAMSECFSNVHEFENSMYKIQMDTGNTGDPALSSHAVDAVISERTAIKGHREAYFWQVDRDDIPDFKRAVFTITEKNTNGQSAFPKKGFKSEYQPINSKRSV